MHGTSLVPAPPRNPAPIKSSAQRPSVVQKLGMQPEALNMVVQESRTPVG